MIAYTEEEVKELLLVECLKMKRRGYNNITSFMLSLNDEKLIASAIELDYVCEVYSIWEQEYYYRLTIKSTKIFSVYFYL